MFNVGMEDALSLWSELEQAWHGTHGFGSDTAEIYAYRLCRHRPTLELGKDSDLGRQALKERAEEAASNLTELLDLFAERRECKIEVNDKSFDPKTGVEPFNWRVRVRVTPNRPIRSSCRAEKVVVCYGREIREDARDCVHGVALGNHCHRCPQCNCPNKVASVEGATS